MGCYQLPGVFVAQHTMICTLFVSDVFADEKKKKHDWMKKKLKSEKHWRLAEQQLGSAVRTEKVISKTFSSTNGRDGRKMLLLGHLHTVYILTGCLCSWANVYRWVLVLCSIELIREVKCIKRHGMRIFNGVNRILKFNIYL